MNARVKKANLSFRSSTPRTRLLCVSGLGLITVALILTGAINYSQANIEATRLAVTGIVWLTMAVLSVATLSFIIEHGE